MTALDELIRESLQATATEHAQPADLAARSMQRGARLRRRQRVGLVSVALASVGAVVAGSLALSGGSSHQAVQRVSSAGQPGVPWQQWTPNRVYGTKPAPSFIDGAGSAGAIVYASGSMPDGTDFVVSYDPSTEHSGIADYTQGWNNVPDFGQSVSEGPTAGPDAQYLTAESPTYEAGQQGGPDSQWLIIVGRPGTTTASFSVDGTTWEPMDVQHGIAVLRLSASVVQQVTPTSSHPTPAQIRLSDATGEYVDGTLALP